MDPLENLHTQRRDLAIELSYSRQVREVGIAGVRLFSSHLCQTRSALIEAPGGAVLVDPAYFPDEITVILDQAKALAGGGQRLAIFTHSDWDHVAATPRLRAWRKLANSRLGQKPEADKQRIVREIADFDATWYIPRSDQAFPVVDQPLSDDVEIDLAGEPARIVWTPGHTDDAIVTILPQRRMMIAGDLLSAIEFPFAQYAVSTYRSTLDRVARLVNEYDLEILIPGHGPIAAERSEIFRRLDDDRQYLTDLWDAVADALEAGHQGEAFKQTVERVNFRGKPIPKPLASCHLDNAERAACEMNGHGSDRAAS